MLFLGAGHKGVVSVCGNVAVLLNSARRRLRRASSLHGASDVRGHLPILQRPAVERLCSREKLSSVQRRRNARGRYGHTHSAGQCRSARVHIRNAESKHRRAPLAKASSATALAVSAIAALSARQTCVQGRKRAQCRNCSTLSFFAFSSSRCTTCTHARAALS